MRPIRTASQFQKLERRQLMAATPLAIAFTAGVINITGSAGDDQITVAQSGNDWTIPNAAWSAVKTFANVKGININGAAGNDSITLDTAIATPATLNGGMGDDTLVGGSGSDKLYGSVGADSIDGGSGDDLVQGGVDDGDTLGGGDGTDTLDYTDHVLGARIYLQGSGNCGSGGETDVVYADFEIAQGSAGNDTIRAGEGDETLYGNAGNDLISGANGDEKFFGGAGNDTMLGSIGFDWFYGGAGTDSINGGGGDDTIITLGGDNKSTVTGGAGDDNYWVDSAETVTDASVSESNYGAVHKVAALYGNKGAVVSNEFSGQALADPTIGIGGSAYRNFKNNPLFSNDGPALADIEQGQIGDCYFLAQIGSYAHLSPDLLRNSIVDLGDGTYAVHYKMNGTDKYYRVDADLPSYSATQTSAAGLGQGNSTWVALMEKAWTCARSLTGTYASISSGWMGEVAAALSRATNWTDVSTSSDGNALLSTIKDAVAAGKSVTVGTNGSQPSGSIIVGGHAYAVMSVQSDGNGGYTITMRNPWGIDGYTVADGSNDGFVTINAAQFIADIDAINYANVNATASAVRSTIPAKVKTADLYADLKNLLA